MPGSPRVGVVLRVGLTGGIASGKTTVARVWSGLGAVLVDSDLLARQVVAPDSAGLASVRERFGPSVVTAEGSLDRAALGALVFGDDAARRDLEAIIHPLVARRTAAIVAAAPPDAIVVHDIPLLVELHREGDYDLVVVVGASAETRTARMVRDRGMSPADAARRIAAQASDEQRHAVADVWISNEGTPAELEAEAVRVWREVVLPRAGK